MRYLEADSPRFSRAAPQPRSQDFLVLTKMKQKLCRESHENEDQSLSRKCYLSLILPGWQSQSNLHGTSETGPERPFSGISHENTKSRWRTQLHEL